MKIYPVRFKIALAIGAAAILAIFITKPGYSQENVKKESTKKIILKIVTDEDGARTVIDTTLLVTDTSMMDSVRKEIDRVIRIGKGVKRPHFKFHNLPEGYAYDFDFDLPPIPDCPMILDELNDFEWEGTEPQRKMEERILERTFPGPERRIMRQGGSSQTLNDVLGDIPMDRVVGYSVKDRKHGRRIIIDLDNAPMFERQNRVIVLREPGKMKRHRNNQKRQVKVFMDSEGDNNSGGTPEAPQPATPPPPPPPADKNRL